LPCAVPAGRAREPLADSSGPHPARRRAHSRQAPSIRSIRSSLRFSTARLTVMAPYQRRWNPILLGESPKREPQPELHELSSSVRRLQLDSRMRASQGKRSGLPRAATRAIDGDFGRTDGRLVHQLPLPSKGRGASQLLIPSAGKAEVWPGETKNKSLGTMPLPRR
jgi:hypothetical protein